MAERRCGTCKHFEAAPMWKKGWCRNPLLYSPQQSHLVGEDDLDCNRGMGSYWEALDSELDDEEPLTRFAPPAARTIAPASAAGANFPRREREAAAVTRPRMRRPEALASDTPEHYQDAPLEHYAWGDYLRRTFPAIAVILLVGVLWLWMSQQLASTDNAAEPTPLATVQAGLAGVAPNVITPTAPAGQPAANNPAPAVNATPTLPTPPPGVIAPGAQVIVSAFNNGANIRQDATTASNRVTTVADGTVLTITGESKDADGYTWWPVRGDGFEGWVAGSLIKAR